MNWRKFLATSTSVLSLLYGSYAFSQEAKVKPNSAKEVRIIDEKPTDLEKKISEKKKTKAFSFSSSYGISCYGLDKEDCKRDLKFTLNIDRAFFGIRYQAPISLSEYERSSLNVGSLDLDLSGFGIPGGKSQIPLEIEGSETGIEHNIFLVLGAYWLHREQNYLELDAYIAFQGGIHMAISRFAPANRGKPVPSGFEDDLSVGIVSGFDIALNVPYVKPGIGFSWDFQRRDPESLFRQHDKGHYKFSGAVYGTVSLELHDWFN